MLDAYSRTLAKLGRRDEAEEQRVLARAILREAPSRVAREHTVDVSDWLKPQP